jgi:hypothetical protein
MSGIKSQIVALPIAEMDASGTGVIDSIKHTNVLHTGITHEFRISLVKTHELFTAFTWADKSTEGNVDASSGYADFDISLNQAQFATALAYVIANATGGKSVTSYSIGTTSMFNNSRKNYVELSNLGTATRTAQTVLDREVRKEVEDLLDANQVMEYLEGDSLGQFNLVLDASDGGANMADLLGDVNTAALRNLFLQIPTRNSEDAALYGDEAGSRLPLKGGDVIAFIFNVNPVVNITQSDVSAPNPVAPSTAPVMEGANDLSKPDEMSFVDNAATLITAQRKIAFVIDVEESA